MKDELTGGIEFRIRVISGQMKGKAYRLLGNSVVIGRGEKADIRINDTNMSREHARIQREGAEFTIYDLDSKNGILYKNKKVKKTVLLNDDKFQLGDTDFQFIEYSLNQSRTNVTKEQILQPLPREIASDEPTGKSAELGISKDKLGSESKFSFFKSKPKSFSGKSSENIRRLILYGILIGAFGFSFAVKKGIINLDKKSGATAHQTGKEEQNSETNENIGLSESDLKNLLKDEPRIDNDTTSGIDVNELYSKSLLSYDLKRYNDAISILDKIISLDPNHSQARIKKIEWLKERDTLAEKIFKQAAHYYENRYFTEAETQFKMVIQLIPEQNHHLHRQAAESLKSLSQM